MDLLDPNTGDTIAIKAVRGSPNSCYTQPGMGVVKAAGESGAGDTLLAVMCPEGFYGAAEQRFGLSINPCIACPTGMITAGSARATTYVSSDGTQVAISKGGFYSLKSCVTPPGWGYYGEQAQECPQGFWNEGNNRLTCTQ